MVARHRYVYATYPRALILAPKNLANLSNCKNPKIFLSWEFAGKYLNINKTSTTILKEAFEE